MLKKIFIFFDNLIYDFQKKLGILKSANDKNINGLIVVSKPILTKFFVSKNFPIIFCGLIIILSIFLRYQMDTGSETALLLGLAQKISLGENLQNFTDQPIFIFHYFYLLPLYLSKILAIHISVIAALFFDLGAFVSFYFFISLLNKSKIYEEKFLRNLLIVIFSLILFLRIFNVEYNEFGTQNSFLLLFLFPYFCFYLPRNHRGLSKAEKISKGILAFLISAPHPLYILFPLIMEISESLIKKEKNFFRLERIIFLFFLLLFSSQYLEMLRLEFFGIDYKAVIHNSLNSLFTAKILFVLAVVILIFIRSGFSETDKIFFSLLTSAGLVFVLFGKIDNDNLSAIYSIFIFILSKFTHDIFKNNLFNSQSRIFNWFLLSFIFIIFSDHSTYDFIFVMMVAWPVLIVPILLPIFKNPALPNNFKIEIIFAILLGLTLMIWQEIYEEIWLGSIALFAGIVVREIYEKKYNFSVNNYFSKSATSFITIVIFYFVSLNLNSGISAYKMNNYFKSPNKLSEEFYRHINKYAHEKDIAIISNWNAHTYPLVSYANIASYNLPASFISLFSQRDDKNFENVFYLKLLEELKNKKPILIFINNDVSLNKGDKSCYVGFVEYYLRDKNFAKRFKNYRFLNRIIVAKDMPFRPALFGERDHEKYKNIVADQEYLYDFDVYMRNDY